MAEYEARTRDPLDLLALSTLWLVVVPPGDFGHRVTYVVLAYLQHQTGPLGVPARAPGPGSCCSPWQSSPRRWHPVSSPRHQPGQACAAGRRCPPRGDAGRAWRAAGPDRPAADRYSSRKFSGRYR